MSQVEAEHYKSLHWMDRKALRDRYVEAQGGACWHCKEPLKGEPSVEVQEAWIDKGLFPATMFDYPEHLHHSHKTGMTIGTVHARCNAFLWQYKGE